MTMPSSVSPSPDLIVLPTLAKVLTVAGTCFWEPHPAASATRRAAHARAAARALRGPPVICTNFMKPI